MKIVFDWAMNLGIFRQNLIHHTQVLVSRLPKPVQPNCYAAYA